jgi:hypothetical protein
MHGPHLRARVQRYSRQWRGKAEAVQLMRADPFDKSSPINEKEMAHETSRRHFATDPPDKKDTKDGSVPEPKVRRSKPRGGRFFSAGAAQFNIQAPFFAGEPAKRDRFGLNNLAAACRHSEHIKTAFAESADTLLKVRAVGRAALESCEMLSRTRACLHDSHA